MGKQHYDDDMYATSICKSTYGLPMLLPIIPAAPCDSPAARRKPMRVIGRKPKSGTLMKAP
jgi:hypothetical protein